MKKYFNYLGAILLGTILIFGSCSKDDETTDPPPPAGPGESTSDLLVKKFTAAPDMDGNTLDDMWGTAQTLVGTSSVPTTLANRQTYYNPDGEGIEEGLGIFEPYAGESNDFKLRAGYFGDMIYFRMEWDDDADSKDRQSWYFDSEDMLWKGEHKYANDDADKFYEDKFAFLFPIGTVDGFTDNTCWATCHQGLTITSDGQKHSRHYTTNVGEVVDMWHWKRVRGTYAGQIDDQRIVYNAGEDAGANGRGGDVYDDATSGYSNNKQTLNNGSDDVDVPLYVVPNGTDYYWISSDDFGGTAKLITAVDENGVLSYEGGAIDPIADGGYEQGSGAKRIPSITTREFTGGRADLDISAVYTGTGWVCEFKRKLNTGDPEDVVFDVTKELAFGLAIFDNAAIAHGIKPGLTMKYEQ